MNATRNIFCTVSFFGLLILFAGCSSTVELTVSDTGALTVSYATAFGPAVMETVSAVSGVPPEDSSVSPFNADIMREQSEALGFTGVSIKTPAPNQLTITGRSARAIDVIRASETVRISTDRQQKTVTVTLSPHTMGALYAQLPHTLRAYLDLLSAPIFTGDAMGRAEYLEFISSLYGEKLAAEVADAAITLILTAPNRTQKRYVIPLVDMLVMDAPQSFTYTLSW